MDTTDHYKANIALVDEHTQQVAALLPFPVELDADMGGTWALHIDLGRRGGADDPPDTAGVDPDPDNGNLEWWFDVDGGCETVISEHTIHSDPAAVAAWITEQARRFNSPAAL
ncbi:MAG: hypothetical protein ACTIKQ_04505 [Microbacterium sp.]